MRRLGGVGLLWLTLAFAGGSLASAGLKIDLAKIVVDQLPGYAVAEGMGINGPVSKEQFISLSSDPARVRAKLKGRFVRIYAHTFVRQDGGRAVVIAMQFDRPAASKGFVSGVREAAAAKGQVTPVPGLTDGGRSTLPPSDQVPVPLEQVFFRSGRLGFLFTVSGSQTLPDPSDEAVRLARIQAARVPHDVSSERDIADTFSYKLGYLLFPAAIVVLVFWFVRRRRRRRSPTVAVPEL